MWLYFLLFAIGMALLIKGADIVVAYASRVARMLGVSNFMIGLTLVAFSTTLPELSVSMLSAFSGVVDIATGTTIGSIIANVAFILALAAVLVPLRTNREIIKLNYILLLYLLLLSVLLLGGLVWYEGLILLAFFSLYMTHMIRTKGKSGPGRAKKARRTRERGRGIIKYTALTIIGGSLVALGAKLLIDSTVNISKILAIPEFLIALVAVAIGTSLPELAVCVTAAFKRIPGISIGDILGANMFNVMVLAITSLIVTVPVTAKMTTLLIPVMLLVNALLLIFMKTDLGGVSEKWQLSRWEGLILLSIYAVFIYMQFV